jgi:hypothetical protein
MDDHLLMKLLKSVNVKAKYDLGIMLQELSLI